MKVVAIHRASDGMKMFEVGFDNWESLDTVLREMGSGYMRELEWQDKFRFRFPDPKGGFYTRYIAWVKGAE